MDWQERIEERLQVRLKRSVPDVIRAYLRVGGPTDNDRERVSNYAHDIGAHGDIMLFPDKKDSFYEELMNKFVDGVAVAAFAPGGIHCFGLDFEVPNDIDQQENEMQELIDDINSIIGV